MASGLFDLDKGLELIGFGGLENADSNFIPVQFIRTILSQNGTNVILISLHEPLQFYQLLGKRLGYDFNPENGRVHVIDTSETYLCNFNVDLHEIYMRIQQLVDRLRTVSQSKKIFIICDDLSHFFDLGLKPNDVLMFINFIFNLNGTVAILGCYNGDDKDRIIVNALKYHCDRFFNIYPLKSGHSGQVTGALQIDKRQSNVNTQIIIDQYHFKTYEKGVKVFHPGEGIYNLYK